jgi:hypothetical protein
LPVAIEPVKKPRVGDVSGENNMAMTHADEVPRGMERAVKVIEAHLIKWLLVARPNHIVTEGHKGHVDGFDPAEEIRVNRSGQNEPVNQAMFLKNRRQVDSIGRRSRGIMQRGEEHVLFQAGGIGFDALQDASMKGMEKIAVAQEKADHFSASLENPAGLRIGAESQTPDGRKYSRTGFPAYLRAGIQHPGNRSYANGSGLGNLANRRFLWNCFHDREAFCRFGAVLGSVRSPPTLSAGESSIPAPR